MLFTHSHSTLTFTMGNLMTKQLLKPTLLAMGLSGAAMCFSAHAAQVATDPGDYSPLPAGIDLGILYLQSFHLRLQK